MKNFKKVTSVDKFSPGTSGTFNVGGNNVALFNVGGEFFAIDDACVHAGGPLGAGPLDGRVVTCPWHGWQFDVTKGCAVMSDEIKLRRYQVIVEKGWVYISKEALGG